ncbi:hypothetical protein V8B97DRAFT_2026721 [Scleroderma yunnanense]
MLHPDSDEDFTSNIGAIDDKKSSQGEQAVICIKEMWKALHMLGSTADVQELRKKVTKLDLAICNAAKNSTHWSSPEAMADGTIKELYEVIPMELHKQMKTYKPFVSLFHKTLNTKHSNLVKAIKENAALLFMPLGLNSTSKATNNELLLLKQPENLSPDGKYKCLALILLTDPKNMSPNTLLKSRILLNMAYLLMFGKSLLSDKKRGQPRAIGELMGANCVTEGMIAGLAIMAHYLLSHDTELSPEGNNTKIPYYDNFNFYVKLLFKCNNWSREVMDYYNEDPDVPPSITSPAQVESQQPLQADCPPVTVATVCPPPSVSQTTSASALDLGANVNHQALVSISPRSFGDVDLSAMTQVHLGIERLSLTSPGAKPGQSVLSAHHTSTASKWRITPVTADAPLTQLPKECVTQACAKK